MTDTEYMQIALEEARKSADKNEIPIGALLVYHDTIIASAHNEREHSWDPTAHAEILVLRKGARILSNWRLTPCTLYVTIEPCAMCAGAIMNARIGRLVYGAPDHRAGGVDSHFHICEGGVMNHHITIQSDILSDKCQKVMDSFFAKRR